MGDCDAERFMVTFAAGLQFLSEVRPMTRLVLTLLVIATAIVAGILFYPKQRHHSVPATEQNPLDDSSSHPKATSPSSLIDF